MQRIRRTLNDGVCSIEHGHLADEDTVAHIGEKEVWLSMQPFAEDDHHYPDPDRSEKNRRICHGTDDVYRWAKKHGVKVAFGTDLLLEPESAPRQSVMAARLGDHYTNLEALKMLTSGNAELFEMAGERNSYASAKLGIIAPGAWADMLVVEGNPIEDLSLITDPQKNFKVIIKGGVIEKNSL
ncbi:hypothetical protein RhoFasB10_00972 [Rhodococcus sp. B10]|nr:hypothetical protein [Rhodococcus sp. B10]